MLKIIKQMVFFETYLFFIENNHFMSFPSLPYLRQIQTKFKVIIIPFGEFFQFYTEKISFYCRFFGSIFILFIKEIWSIKFIYILAPSWCVITCCLNISYDWYMFKILVKTEEWFRNVKIFAGLELFFLGQILLTFFHIIKFLFGQYLLRLCPRIDVFLLESELPLFHNFPIM